MRTQHLSVETCHFSSSSSQEEEEQKRHGPYISAHNCIWRLYAAVIRLLVLCEFESGQIEKSDEVWKLLYLLFVCVCWPVSPASGCWLFSDEELNLYMLLPWYCMWIFPKRKKETKPHLTLIWWKNILTLYVTMWPLWGTKDECMVEICLNADHAQKWCHNSFIKCNFADKVLTCFLWEGKTFTSPPGANSRKNNSHTVSHTEESRCAPWPSERSATR